MLAIETSQLRKDFGTKRVLCGLDLEVPYGAVYGFIGDNGAGKSTTIRLLLGLLRPSHGRVLLLGRDVATDRLRALAEVGALVESPSLYQHLSARDNLQIIQLSRGGVISRQAQDEALRRVGLLAEADQRVSTLSLGTKQRLAIAAALLGQPRLLILDEPTNGLDPAATIEFREIIRELAELGVTVMLSSHVLAELERVASHVGVLSNGTLMYQGSLKGFLERQRRILRLSVSDSALTARVLQAAGFELTSARDDFVRVYVSAREDVAHAVSLVCAAAISVFHAGVEASTLEGAFLGATANSALEQR